MEAAKPHQSEISLDTVKINESGIFKFNKFIYGSSLTKFDSTGGGKSDEFQPHIIGSIGSMAASHRMTVLNKYVDYVPEFNIYPKLMGLKIDKVIGQGCFGIVFQCGHILMERRKFGVKLIPFNGLDPHSNKTISSEKLYCDLPKHTNIVKALEFKNTELTMNDINNIESIVKETGSEDNKDYFSFIVDKVKGRQIQNISVILLKMELCGENLTDWLRLNCHKAESIKTCESLQNIQFKIVTGLVEAVKFIHSQKIIHRDIKPGNILFSKRNFMLPVKLCDFGVCYKLETDEVNIGERIGSDAYRAPEMDSSQYGFNADLFSMGLIMFEVLQLIGRQERNEMFMELVMNENVIVVIPHVRILNSKEIIVALTKRNPVDRIQSIHEVVLVSLMETNYDTGRTPFKQVISHRSSTNAILDNMSSSIERLKVSLGIRKMPSIPPLQTNPFRSRNRKPFMNNFNGGHNIAEKASQIQLNNISTKSKQCRKRRKILSRIR
ncbi:glycogen synthase kinase 1 isoform X2 [Folsomia candida]|nr:glycogen synthase kinase 1 isoform X2 [Folsomia candida]